MHAQVRVCARGRERERERTTPCKTLNVDRVDQQKQWRPAYHTFSECNNHQAYSKVVLTGHVSQGHVEGLQLCSQATEGLQQFRGRFTKNVGQTKKVIERTHPGVRKLFTETETYLTGTAGAIEYNEILGSTFPIPASTYTCYKPTPTSCGAPPTRSCNPLFI